MVNRDQEIIIGENKDDPEDENESKNFAGEDFSLVEKTEIEGAKGMNILGDKTKGAQKQRPGKQDEIRKDMTDTGPMGLDPNAQSTP